MFGANRERLDAAPFRVPRPRRAAMVRWAVSAALVVLAGLVLLAGGPGAPHAQPVAGPARPFPPPGTVGVPVLLANAGAAGIVRAGDRVDVLAAVPDRVVLAADVLVLSVQPPGDVVSGGAVLYVAAGPIVARRLAGAAPDTPLAITVRPP